MVHRITIEAVAGAIPALLSLPSRPNGSGIVLGMSVWGLNSQLSSWADFMADLGYAVIAPNLFWRSESDHAIDYDFSRFERVAELMNEQTDDQGVEDLRLAAEELQRLSGCGKPAVVGWCYGGRLACLCGLGSDFGALVAFYPTILETRLDIAGKLQAPLSLHLPEIEQYATREDAIEQIVDAFQGYPDVETFVYPDVKHGFGFPPPHPNYDFAASRLADTRAALFLHQTVIGDRM